MPAGAPRTHRKSTRDRLQGTKSLMQSRSKRVINAMLLLPLICLFILLGGNTCEEQISPATRAPISLTAELPLAPLASQGFTAVPTPPIEFELVSHSQDSRLTAEWAGEAAILQIFSDGASAAPMWPSFPE